jgi:phosphomannomutase/phosphoglucomutase
METSLPVSKTIFRAYDIRGIVEETLDKHVMHQIGQAIATEALEQGETTIVTGRDGRLSGPKLSQALIEGLLCTGIDVIDIGRVPTPLLYYATHTTKAKSGVMLTGSHNPVNHNGTKIVINQKALSGKAIQALYKRIEAKSFKQGKGELTKQDLIPEYVKRILSDATLGRPLKVVIDCGNGIAGLVAPMLLREMGCKVHELYCDVDGNFPNHHPDPSQTENLQDLIQMVCQKRADIGLAFDGDGDRLGVVTGTGDVIWPDRQMILYAKDVLANYPGAPIIYDVKSTRLLGQKIKEFGGEPIMYKTGHSLVKAKIREINAPLGGEMSGHIFFNDRWYGFDDALYTAARLLEILSNDDREIEAIFAELPDSISTPELRIYMDDERKFTFMDELQASAEFEGEPDINTIDGLRVDYPDSWGLVRASNTTPYLIVRFEADNEKALKQIQSSFRQSLLALDSELSLPF